MADFQASFLVYCDGLITPYHLSSVVLSIRTVRAGSVIVEGAPRFATELCRASQTYPF
jgi:hypothetical protein